MTLASYDLSTMLLLVILITAVSIDLWRHRIPNVLSLGAIVLGFGLQAWALGVDGLLIGLGGLGIGLLIFLPFYLLGGMGAGDVKLMAAVGTFLGPTDTLLAAGLSLVVGAVLGGLVALARRGALAALRRAASTLKVLPSPGVAPQSGAAAVPFALAIGIGTVVAMWWLAQLSRLLGM